MSEKKADTNKSGVWLPKMFGWRSYFAYFIASQLIIILTYTGHLNEWNAMGISVCYATLAGKASLEILMPKGALPVQPYFQKLFGWRTVSGFLYACSLYLLLTFTGKLTDLNSYWLTVQFMAFAGKSAAEYASNIRGLFQKNPRAVTGITSVVKPSEPEDGEF